ncbi:MAG TPA: hypothetical protein VFT82_04070 [Candidatus Paceibacterota bacterium]|nr:hypothetical protein [Candidatus Paceibacterota bacterium]
MNLSIHAVAALAGTLFCLFLWVNHGLNTKEKPALGLKTFTFLLWSMLVACLSYFALLLASWRDLMKKGKLPWHFPEAVIVAAIFVVAYLVVEHWFRGRRRR